MSKTAIALVATVALTILLFAGSHAQPQVAQPQTFGRFQMMAFDYHSEIPNSCGAYILDTQNGEIYQVIGKSPPEMLGSVEAARKKKVER